MKNLFIDLETYSSISLSKAGVYRYCESEDFEILLFGFSVDGGEVRVVDIACGESLPSEIVQAILDPSIRKWAYNAQFERVCLSRYLNKRLAPDSWRCTMVWAATLGLPLSLEGSGAVLAIEDQKLKEGKDLVRFFCMPCTPGKVNKFITRNLPGTALEKWERFKEYNKRDVETELAIHARLAKFPVPESEWAYYRLDQEINDRGVRLDMQLVQQAIACDKKYREMHLDLARSITGLENPNSTQQLKSWLSGKGVDAPSLSKAAISEMLEDADGEVESALELRRELAKSSIKKYTAMEAAVCKDGRARGLLQFYGANRTGRWAGRLIQVQNLPQNHLPDLSLARELIKAGRFDVADMLYDSVSIVLSELIRTAFIPDSGSRFFIADFSAIEARVIAWLAGEKWRMDVFSSHGKIYEASASQMFRVPIEEITKTSPLRQKGKISELALGYGGSIGALKAMGALNMGLVEDELQPLVNTWRTANPNITSLWWSVDKAVKQAVREKAATRTHGITFEYQSGILFIALPGGRRLCYIKPKIEPNQYGGESVTYEGIGESKKWMRIKSYGPKFVENIVQAISRDILAEAMLRVEKAGYRIVLHVHDEVVVESAPDTSLEDICECMSQQPSWAGGLPLRADGFVCDFYMKE